MLNYLTLCYSEMTETGSWWSGIDILRIREWLSIN